MNPMMLSTNNGLEGSNNVFKRDFTCRRRVSMPNLVQKLKEFVKGWSKNPIETFDRVSTVSPAVKKSAERLLKNLEDFIRFRKAKDRDRPTVKPRGNVVKELCCYYSTTVQRGCQEHGKQETAN